MHDGGLTLSFAQTALLGALAGFTIYLGLPVARLRLLSPRARVGLAMFAVGILAFIFVDVMEHGFGIVEETLDGYKDGDSSFGHLALLTALLIGGFGVGSAGPGTIERPLPPPGAPPAPSASHPPIAGGSTETAFAPDEALRLASDAD